MQSRIISYTNVEGVVEGIMVSEIKRLTTSNDGNTRFIHLKDGEALKTTSTIHDLMVRINSN